MFVGRRIIVTGASRGIGREIAIECARQGAVVGACYLHSEADAESLRNRYPDNIRLLRFDIRDCEAAKQAIDGFVAEEGGVEGLVNNAGVGGKPSLLMRWSYERILDTIQVNLVGPIVCTKAVIPYFLKNNFGAIVNISSVSAARPGGGAAPYAASKGGIESFTYAIAKEYGSRGIRANAVRLGAVRTKMIDDLPQEAQDAMLQDIFVKDIPGPESIAWIVASLLSPEHASYITGSVLTVDGGFLIK
ncbi:MAG: SDR family NAD(P)-dependent oxidoreductase [Blastocatellales bacterium]